MSLASSLNTANSIFRNTSQQTSVISTNIANTGNENYVRRNAVVTQTVYGFSTVQNERSQQMALLRRLPKILRWARKRTNQELSDYIARFPKAAGKLAANLLRDDHGVPQTNNLKLDVAAHILKRRQQGREAYSPTGEDSV